MTAPTDARARTQIRRQQQLDFVIDTAAALFARNGFGHTGMAELCEAVNMGRGQLYNLIGSKENLLRLVHERFTVLLFEGAAHIDALDLPPGERLRHVLRYLVETIAEHQDYVWVFFNEWRVLGEDNLEIYRRRRREWQDWVEAILHEGVGRGAFSIADTHIAVLGILGMANYSYQWLQPGGRLSATEIADLFADLVLRGIEVRERRPAVRGRDARSRP